MKYLNNKIRLYRNKAGLSMGMYEHNVQGLWNTVPDLYRKIADIKVVLVVTQCVPGDQLDTASSVKLNTSRSWCLYSPLCHQKCWSFCANHLVHIIWQNSRLLVCVYNGYGGGPQNGWIVGAVQSTVIRLKSGMLVKTRIQAGFSITFAVTFRHIGVVWEDDTLVLCLNDPNRNHIGGNRIQTIVRNTNASTISCQISRNLNFVVK